MSWSRNSGDASHLSRPPSNSTVTLVGIDARATRAYTLDADQTVIIHSESTAPQSSFNILPTRAPSNPRPPTSSEPTGLPQSLIDQGTRLRQMHTSPESLTCTRFAKSLERLGVVAREKSMRQREEKLGGPCEYGNGITHPSLLYIYPFLIVVVNGVATQTITSSTHALRRSVQQQQQRQLSIEGWVGRVEASEEGRSDKREREEREERERKRRGRGGFAAEKEVMESRGKGKSKELSGVKARTFEERTALAFDQLRRAASSPAIPKPKLPPKHLVLVLPKDEEVETGNDDMDLEGTDQEDTSDSSILFGLDEWDVDENLTPSDTTKLVGGTVTLKGITSPSSHIPASLTKILRLAMFWSMFGKRADRMLQKATSSSRPAPSVSAVDMKSAESLDGDAMAFALDRRRCSGSGSRRMLEEEEKAGLGNLLSWEGRESKVEGYPGLEDASTSNSTLPVSSQPRSVPDSVIAGVAGAAKKAILALSKTLQVLVLGPSSYLSSSRPSTTTSDSCPSTGTSQYVPPLHPSFSPSPTSTPTPLLQPPSVTTNLSQSHHSDSSPVTISTPDSGPPAHLGPEPGVGFHPGAELPRPFLSWANVSLVTAIDWRLTSSTPLPIAIINYYSFFQSIPKTQFITILPFSLPHLSTASDHPFSLV
ncbi:hypothetical protein BD410DRAFT_888087 [Rickenella mellea]|uniref:Uncharacterized protein n=1 Tax=Rickenella mellea TaxID=50990 RepID=A0A4Y7PP36_9AGAM|nr:hypothetical protein BD410DRAFT_888087 [Rickenella mellea]